MTRPTTRNLYVTCSQRVVGELHNDDAGELAFRYAPEWLEEGFPVSLSLPLADVTYGPEARRFFVNLLPEGVVRRLIARRLGISEDNDWELLAALGGDCAGALALAPALGEEREPSYRALSIDELRELASMPHPGLAAMAGGEARLSLAGAQDKLPIRVTETGEYLLPEGSAASTHIIKFASADFVHLPANEVLVTWLARRLDLPVVTLVLDGRFDPPLCVVERYDRARGEDGRVRRIHQEDLCQALGLPHTRKYQAEGGPGIDRIGEAIEACSTDPIGDTRSLLRWIVFNLLVGNADGHAKNLSLLYDGATPRLAPFYDLVSTRVYRGISDRMALFVGGRSDPGQVAHADWVRLGEQVDVRPAYVVELVDEMTEAMPELLAETADEFCGAYGDSPVLQMLPPVVLRQTRRTRALLTSTRR